MSRSIAQADTEDFSDWPGNVASVNFVNRILTVILAKHDDAITVHPREFVYAAGSKFTTTEMLQVDIVVENITEDDGQIEINVSGTIENSEGCSETFTLFLYLWINRPSLESIRLDYDPLQTRMSFSVICRNPSVSYSDAVFGLDLTRCAWTGVHHDLGHGRGYLMFGN